MKKIEVFAQVEGTNDILLVEVAEDGTVHDLLQAAIEQGKHLSGNDASAMVFIEDAEEVLELDHPLEKAGIRHRGHVHIHRCRHIEVSVTFNGKKITRAFPPSATIGRIKKWAAKEFGMSEKDASEHVLQVTGTTSTPDEDTHVGTLVTHPNCQISFDLVPKVRIEG